MFFLERGLHSLLDKYSFLGLVIKRSTCKAKIDICRFKNGTNIDGQWGFQHYWQIVNSEITLASEVKLCVAVEKGDDCGEGNARQVNHGLQASDRLCQVRFNWTPFYNS